MPSSILTQARSRPRQCHVAESTQRCSEDLAVRRTMSPRKEKAVDPDGAASTALWCFRRDQRPSAPALAHYAQRARLSQADINRRAAVCKTHEEYNRDPRM